MKKDELVQLAERYRKLYYETLEKCNRLQLLVNQRDIELIELRKKIDDTS